MANKALINYYAKLIKRGHIEEVVLPTNLKDLILERVKELPEIESDPYIEMENDDK